MRFKSLQINGLRGFSTLQQLDFALPNGQPGSGLTVLVGPNNGGKSTIVEALRIVVSEGNKSFSEGKRNKSAEDKVYLKIIKEDGGFIELGSLTSGGSEVYFNNSAGPMGGVLVLPARRFFNPYFAKSVAERGSYISNMSVYPFRSNSIDQFASRLFRAQANRQDFDKVLGRVLCPVPKWNIEQADTGQYYLKYDAGGMHHNSEGLGEGLVSLLFIIDALYDSGNTDMIVIDEPELSLHPALQRKLSNLFVEYSSSRQIVIATHSPYFLDLSTMEFGTRVARVYKTGQGSVISELTPETGKSFQGLLKDWRNPHVWGLNAKEIFFLDEGIVLVEGQEDVFFYPKIAKEIGLEFEGTFFGWGVGGASNMKLIAKILKELGFKKVAGILDGNCTQLSNELKEEFPDYSFFTIPTNDVRTKKASPARQEIIGLTAESGNIRSEYSDCFKKLVQEINSIVAS